jgi:hypothetical protein
MKSTDRLRNDRSREGARFKSADVRAMFLHSGREDRSMCKHNCHPGLDPGSTFFSPSPAPQGKWMPDQVRHDGPKPTPNPSLSNPAPNHHRPAKGGESRPDSPPSARHQQPRAGFRKGGAGGGFKHPPEADKADKADKGDKGDKTPMAPASFASFGAGKRQNPPPAPPSPDPRPTHHRPAKGGEPHPDSPPSAPASTSSRRPRKGRGRGWVQHLPRRPGPAPMAPASFASFAPRAHAKKNPPEPQPRRVQPF